MKGRTSKAVAAIVRALNGAPLGKSAPPQIDDDEVNELVTKQIERDTARLGLLRWGHKPEEVAKLIAPLVRARVLKMQARRAQYEKQIERVLKSFRPA